MGNEVSRKTAFEIYWPLDIVGDFYLICLIFLQELIQRAKDVRQDIGQHAEKIPEHQTFLEKDMSRAQAKLRENENRLEEIAAQQSKWEHEMLLLR